MNLLSQTAGVMVSLGQLWHNTCRQIKNDWHMKQWLIGYVDHREGSQGTVHLGQQRDTPSTQSEQNGLAMVKVSVIDSQNAPYTPSTTQQLSIVISKPECPLSHGDTSASRVQRYPSYNWQGMGRTHSSRPAIGRECAQVKKGQSSQVKSSKNIYLFSVKSTFSCKKHILGRPRHAHLTFIHTYNIIFTICT